MISDKVTTTGGQWFDLEEFLNKLERACIPKLRSCGCWHPEECSHDLVTDFVVINKLEKEGRCRISEDKILINYDNAKSQEAVLNYFLKYRILNKKSGCTVLECRFKGTCPLADEWKEDDSGRRIAPVCATSPATPYDALRDKELIDAVSRKFKDPKHRDAFLAYAFDNATHAEIAKRLGIKETRVRKWYSRDREQLQDLASILRPDRNSDGHKDGLSKHSKKQTVPGDGRSD
jgi:Sigma-70, region 4